MSAEEPNENKDEPTGNGEETGKEAGEGTSEETRTQGLDDVRMSFLSHLGELRRRVVFSLAGVLVAFLICWAFKYTLFDFLQQPLILAAPEMQDAQLHQKDLAEVFFTLLKTCLLAAVFVASPIILYNIWKFVAPGLYPNEKRAAIPFMTLGTLFFFLGASFCYYLVIPLGYGFLYEFSAPVADPTLMIDEYFALTTKLLLAFGLVFELPVATLFLSGVGLLTHRTLIKQWRIAVVIAFILAAMLTPPDVITQVMLAGPMLVLYLISVVIAYVLTTRREKRLKAEGLL